MLLPAGRLGWAISLMLCCCFALMSSSAATARGAGAVVVTVSPSGRSDGQVLVLRAGSWSGRSVVELGEGAGKDEASEFAVPDHGGELGDLAGSVGPRLVTGEQEPVGTDT